MECVSGNTLDRLIPRHGMRLNEALKYAVQIVDALARAHSVGIVHRDLKPGNIMVNEHGLVKILDFGLAKLTESTPFSENESTLTMRPSTEDGKIVGTVAYMSPEQAEGRNVDSRSDIFSFGALLYEMVTGRKAFQRDSRLSTLTAILREEPQPAGQVVEALPPELERIIARCLRKDRDRRFQTMPDLKVVLEELKEDSHWTTLSTRPAPKHRATSALRWGIAAIALCIAGVVAFVFRTEVAVPRVVHTIQITNDKIPKHNFVTDGDRIYVGETRSGHSVISQVSTVGGETEQIPTPFPNVQIFDIAPNHSDLLVGSFANDTETELTVWLLPLPFGAPRRLADVVAHDARWSRDGRQIIYANGSSLYLINSDGSDDHKLITVNGVPFGPVFSPTNERLRFYIAEARSASLSSLWEVSVDGTGLRPLFDNRNRPLQECCGEWMFGGRYFVFQSTEYNLSSIWIQAERGGAFHKRSSEPVQVTNGPLSFFYPIPALDGGKLLVLGRQNRGELVHYDDRSRQFVPYLDGISATQVDTSRDGQWVAYVTFPENVLWRSKAGGTERLQLSYSPMAVSLPHWSPDGKQIAFMGSKHGGPWKMFLVSAGGGNPKELIGEERNEADPTWSPDGNTLAFGRLPFFEYGSSGGVTIQVLDLRTGQVTTFPGSDGLYSPRWSPDGRYLVAMPVDSSKLMLFDFKTKKWSELAKGSFTFPNWSHDGKYLYVEDLSQGDEMRRVNIASRRIENIANLKQLRRPSGFIGDWSAPDYDGSPTVIRDAGIEEIYALERGCKSNCVNDHRRGE
jgi:Tol biopolymer transport system component